MLTQNSPDQYEKHTISLNQKTTYWQRHNTALFISLLNEELYKIVLADLRNDKRKINWTVEEQQWQRN